MQSLQFKCNINLTLGVYSKRSFIIIFHVDKTLHRNITFSLSSALWSTGGSCGGSSSLGHRGTTWVPAGTLHNTVVIQCISSDFKHVAETETIKTISKNYILLRSKEEDEKEHPFEDLLYTQTSAESLRDRTHMDEPNLLSSPSRMP